MLFKGIRQTGSYNIGVLGEVIIPNMTITKFGWYLQFYGLRVSSPGTRNAIRTQSKVPVKSQQP